MKNEILTKVFGWMFLGLLITFGAGYVVSLDINMIENIFSGPTYIILVIAEILVGIFLSARIHKMSGPTATCLYLFYTFLTGLTFSSVFIAYEMSSIIIIFLIAALLFGVFALIGKFTKLDLSKISTFLFMGVLGIIILSIINIFVASETLNIVGAIIGLIVFLGYTAYDIQNIMKYNGGIEERNMAIIGAFSLYLDFINVFMDLLRLFGDSKD